MKYVISIFLLVIFGEASAQDRKIKGNAEVGINVATLVTGIPELQVSYFVKKFVGIDFGIIASGGYQLRSHRYIIKKTDQEKYCT